MTAALPLKHQLRPLVILTEEEHDALKTTVNAAVVDLHNHGVDITPEGVTQFKIEGLFTAAVEMIRSIYGYEEAKAVRFLDAHFLNAMARFVESSGETAKKQALLNKLSVPEGTDLSHLKPQG